MRYLQFLRQLLDESNYGAAILQLPLDILFLITNNLALYNKFLLSYTCKALWQVVFQEWDIKVSRLSFKEQVGFWIGLAYTLPSRWVCLKYCKLYSINTLDVPPAFWTSYTTETRIINKRFILCKELPVYPHMYMMFGGPATSRSWKESSIHLRERMSNNNSMRQIEASILLKEVTLLEDGIALACESLGQWIFNSCLHCPTDFGIMISTDEREATIRASHDFGIEGSPMDINWKAHEISHGTGFCQSKLRSDCKKLMDNLC
ncbi:hypothetical protein J3F84DRAFT_408320 [Trichoderma pleuroticola]